MDRNLKTPWDLAEFEQEISLKTDLVSGSSSFGGHRIKGDFSIDLKLGRVVDLGNESADNLKVSDMSKMALSPSGSSKRQRAVNNGIQAASCLVDGCDVDLSNCREYHRRHKVCEIHSKTPQVTIGGHKQRFCQQCSRFHSLEEFDDGKRSCRKRLDGHNRRRRKPQPEILPNTGSFLSPNCQASRVLPFLGPQVCPSTTVAKPVWAGVVKPGEDAKLLDQHHGLHLLHKQIPLPGSSSRHKGGGMQFSNLHSTNIAFSNQTLQEGSVCQPHLRNVVSSESGGCSHEMFFNDLSNRVLNLDCALSLLSSPPTQTSGISLSHVVPPVHPSGPSLHCNSLEPMNSVLVSNASQNDFHRVGMFCTGPDVPSDPETVPFHWQL